MIAWRSFPNGRLLTGVCLAAVLGLLACTRQLPAQKIHDELLRRTPYDLLVIQVDAETTEQIQIEPLDFGDPPGEARKVPEYRKGSVLEVRLLADPDEVYEVTWGDVALLQLYEEVLIGEANLLVAQDRLDDAFEYFTFLSRHYPGAPRLEESVSRYLYLNAQKWFNQQRVLEALSLLEELYQRNPEYDHDGSGQTVVTAIAAAAAQILTGYIEGVDVQGTGQGRGIGGQTFEPLHTAVAGGDPSPGGGQLPGEVGAHATGGAGDDDLQIG